MTANTTSSEPSAPSKPTRAKWQHSANLPTLAKKDDSKLTQDFFESILWRIDAKSVNNETMAVGIVGCQRKSGSTTIASNLAMQASNQQRGRVLLIDANWRPPGVLKSFDLPETTGLYDILSGEVSPRECEPLSVTENLDVMCRGKWDEEQPAHVRQEMVDEMLNDLKTEYCLILVDLPPAEDLRSALPLARRLDGSLLVARFESLKQPQARRSLQRLQECGVAVWGSILNRYREYVPKWLRDRI
ncbi:MAG: CpsD/CapB family tyrosine-protein kinase [Planctomycetota bacterium]